MGKVGDRLIKAATEAAALAKEDAQKQDAVMTDGIQMLLRVTKLLQHSAAHELSTDLPKASAIVMSMLATATMLYVRGYPKEAWATQFSGLAEYYAKVAREAEVKEGEANVGAT